MITDKIQHLKISMSMTTLMTSTPNLGRGRFPAIMVSRLPAYYKLVTCSECKRVFSILKGKGHKVFKTCSQSCSNARQSNQRVNYTKKVIVSVPLDIPDYERIQTVAWRQGMRVSKYVKGLVMKDVGHKL